MTSWLAHYGVLAIFVLMFVDAIFPAASELVMVYAGALASGALTHRVDVFGWHGTGFSAVLAVVLAGVIGYQLGAGPRGGPRGGDRLPAGRRPRLGDRPPRRPPLPRASREVVPPHAREARARRRLVRSVGRLGGVSRADHPRRPLFRLDPGGRLRKPVPAVQRAHPRWEHDL